jgi:hypothetical protein
VLAQPNITKSFDVYCDASGTRCQVFIKFKPQTEIYFSFEYGCP